MHDLLIKIIFFVFAALAVMSALMVITQNNPVKCVLFLVLTFVASSVLWILVSAEFLALILVLVYVGAVMTLFLFVVMMLNIDVETMKINVLRHLPFGLIIVALLIGLLLVAVPESWFHTGVENSLIPIQPAAAEAVPALSNTEQIGMVLYTQYFFAFELAAVLLLSAIVAVITLVHQRVIRSKRQDVVQQIMVRREDRVTLLNMKSEK